MFKTIVLVIITSKTSTGACYYLLNKRGDTHKNRKQRCLYTYAMSKLNPYFHYRPGGGGRGYPGRSSQGGTPVRSSGANPGTIWPGEDGGTPAGGYPGTPGQVRMGGTPAGGYLGYPLTRSGQGVPWLGTLGTTLVRSGWGETPAGVGVTSQDRTADGVLDTPRSICLLRSRRRTFLFRKCFRIL